MSSGAGERYRRSAGDAARPLQASSRGASLGSSLRARTREVRESKGSDARSYSSQRRASKSWISLRSPTRSAVLKGPSRQIGARRRAACRRTPPPSSSRSWPGKGPRRRSPPGEALEPARGLRDPRQVRRVGARRGVRPEPRCGAARAVRGGSGPAGRGARRRRGSWCARSTVAVELSPWSAVTTTRVFRSMPSVRRAASTRPSWASVNATSSR